jgi:DNA-binding SARP family transcriptional activator
VYRGPFLDGLTAAWALGHTTGFEQQALDAYADLADLISDHDPAAAADLLDQAIDTAPYAERLYIHLMRLHTAAGRPDAVRATYRRLSFHLSEINANPSRDAEALSYRARPRPPLDPTIKVGTRHRTRPEDTH